MAIANQPPALAPISDRIVAVAAQLIITNFVTDLEVTDNAVRYSLDEGAPYAALHPVTGVLTWVPWVTDASRPHPFTVRAAYLNHPELASTQTFTILVSDALQLTLGTALVRPGVQGRLPLDLKLYADSSSSVTNLSFVLVDSSRRLTGFQLMTTVPGIQSQIQSLSPAETRFELSAPANLGLGTVLTHLEVELTTGPSQPSAIADLALTTSQASTTTGKRVGTLLTQPGRCLLLAETPLLEAVWVSPGRAALRIYGNSGATYHLESTTTLQPSLSWSSEGDVLLRASPQDLELTNHTASQQFYRVRN